MDNEYSAFSAGMNEESDIAIIGMACRFPGANDIVSFWRNLHDGVESISFFTDEELKKAGVDAALLGQPGYVKAGAIISDIEMFDAFFFGYTPREAELLDPQQRLFLESAAECIEGAGYAPDTYGGVIGVYAGVGMNSYLLRNVYPNIARLGINDFFQVFTSSDKDFLATRIAYKLNLKGPSMSVQTACSTSLVAVHMACQGLLNGECDMVLAGGVTVRVPQKQGYRYHEGMISSPDGHCRAFDIKAQGTVGGNGVGIVLLKRLADAIADGDQIHAVIKGSAVNNDGADKVGFTAPGVDGQAAVIAEAQAVAGVEPDTISYVEAHGTGTALGDPIEVAALTQAFRSGTEKKRFCALGSVKTNVGHLDAAAGVAGLIKTALALKNKMIPPSLHFEQPNPEIDFANSPFYMNTALKDWTTNGTPRRAGVSSFGVGGTNAHVILEEAPESKPSGPSRAWQLLVLSAKTGTALDMASANLNAFFQRNPECNLADVAYTLSTGRRSFSHRRALVCRDAVEAAGAITSGDPKRFFTGYQEHRDKPVAFMFSGQGAQYVNMGRDIYKSELVFRESVDCCSDLLKPHLGFDLRQVLYPAAKKAQEATEQLMQTAVTQPALFVVEYALAQVWIARGIRPHAMIGHSVGEYVAACLADVFSLEEALRLVAARGRLMQQQPHGAMLAVPLSEEEVVPQLGEELCLAAVNESSLCVVSGPEGPVDSLKKGLTERGVKSIRLHTSHAFHSKMMDPVVGPFIEEVRKVRLQPPRIPYVSNVTGSWITAAEATDPAYWTRHLRQCVRFSDGIGRVLLESGSILLEVGPGHTLSTMVTRHSAKTSEHVVLGSLRHPRDHQSDEAFLLATLGKLWLSGAGIDWAKCYGHERRHRVPLPTYYFERQRCWVDPSPPSKEASVAGAAGLDKKTDVADWFYIPSWKRTLVPSHRSVDMPIRSCWIVFVDGCGVGDGVTRALEQQGHAVVTIKEGSEYAKLNDGSYTLNPVAPNDYDALVADLKEKGQIPGAIVHLWSLGFVSEELSGRERVERATALGYYSLLFLARTLGKMNLDEIVNIEVVTNGLQDVIGEEALCPEKATILGPCRVIPQEYPNVRCRSIDVVLPPSGEAISRQLANQVLREISAGSSDTVVAYRGGSRWTEMYEPIRLDSTENRAPLIRQRGVYLITGGLGEIGLVLAEYLATTAKAKLILLGRSVFPGPEERQKWLDTHGENDAISRKILKLRELETLGAHILTVSADVANEQQMSKTVTLAEERLGSINGIIHAAGVVGAAALSSVSDAGKVECEQQFHPKVYGLLVLEKLLASRRFDFCVVLSSLSAVLGGLGFSAYAAANSFMDAFVNKTRRSGVGKWVSIDWDGWQFEEAHKQQQNTSVGAAVNALAISPTEGAEAFHRIFLSKSDVNQVVVSTGDLYARIDQWVRLKSMRKTDAYGDNKSASFHPRPNLSQEYVAPRNEAERALTDIWQEILGIEQVGVHDNFFELGGQSLLGTTIITRVRKTLKTDVPLNSLFENPTVAELAVAVGTRESVPGQVETIARLREKITKMSAEEVQALLREKQATKESVTHE